ncbi:MAG TPA: sulfotransferase [Rhizomicrobium sp.]|jgi:hypothetical protein|nr:sulfotransferase [Rhizomicrobium sp.]
MNILNSLFRRAPVLGKPEPDFLCVGMVKAATDWLFDQLLHHRDFWIPPVKELRYLNVPVPRMDNTLRKLSHHRAKGRSFARDVDFAFLEEAGALADQPRDIDKYAALFRFKGSLLSGDISPGYYDLDAETIAAIARRFPSLRVVLTVREPLERVWSHLSMRSREGHFDATLLEDVRAFSRWFAESEVRRACFPTRVAQNWSTFAPEIAFRHFFFDDVEARPETVRADIVAFLGGNPCKKSGRLAAGYNRKANLPKLRMPEPIRAFLLSELADEIRGCAEMFGGHAERWPTRYNL